MSGFAGSHDILAGDKSVRGDERAKGKPPFFWGALCAGFALLIVYTAGAWSIIRHPVTGTYPPSWTIERVKGGWVIASVSPRAHSFLTVRAGDRILSIDGDRRAERTGLAPFLAISATRRLTPAGCPAGRR